MEFRAQGLCSGLDACSSKVVVCGLGFVVCKVRVDSKVCKVLGLGLGLWS